MKLRLAPLSPRLMNIYGDRGNILCLERRCRERGIAFELTELDPGEKLKPKEHDLIFIGGAQDREQRRVAEDLVGVKGKALREAARAGVVVLAVCGGYQLLGRYYRTAEGVAPLGRVVSGFGNNGADGGEGVDCGNAFGTYLHGSLLPKNPRFADHLIEMALRRLHEGFELAPLDDRVEEAAHAAAVRLATRRGIISV